MVSDLAMHTQLNQGYTLYLNAGEDPVKLYKGNDFLSGGTAMSDFTIGEDYSGDKLYVSSGGEISNIVVERNGSALISSGGVANGNTVNSNGNLRVYNGGLASNTTVNAIGRLFVYGGVADNNTVNSKGTVNVSGGAHGNGSNGSTLVDGDIFITVTDSVIGISEGETISYGAIYGRGQQDNDTVMGDSTITLSGVTTVGRVAAKYSGEKESAYYTALILNSFTGVITDSIGSDIDLVVVSGESNGTINSAEEIANWEFNLTDNSGSSTMLNWDGGIFQNDRIDLRVSSQNKVDWTLPNLNPDNNVGSDDAFDGTTFTLFIDDEAGIELTINQTISGGEFDGYSLKYESDQLTFGKLATVWTIFRRNW